MSRFIKKLAANLGMTLISLAILGTSMGAVVTYLRESGGTMTGTLQLQDYASNLSKSLEGASGEQWITFQNASEAIFLMDKDDTTPMAVVRRFQPNDVDMPVAGSFEASYFRSPGTAKPTVLTKESGAANHDFVVHKDVEGVANATEPNPVSLLIETETTATTSWFATFRVDVHNPHVLVGGADKDRIDFIGKRDSDLSPSDLTVNWETPFSTGEARMYISDFTNDWEKYWFVYDPGTGASALDEDWEIHDAGGCIAELALTNVGDDAGQIGTWQGTCD